MFVKGHLLESKTHKIIPHPKTIFTKITTPSISYNLPPQQGRVNMTRPDRVRVKNYYPNLLQPGGVFLRQNPANQKSHVYIFKGK
jgi:hypothetical protein